MSTRLSKQKFFFSVFRFCCFFQYIQTYLFIQSWKVSFTKAYAALSLPCATSIWCHIYPDCFNLVSNVFPAQQWQLSMALLNATVTRHYSGQEYTWVCKSRSAPRRRLASINVQWDKFEALFIELFKVSWCACKSFVWDEVTWGLISKTFMFVVNTFVNEAPEPFSLSDRDFGPLQRLACCWRPVEQRTWC